MWLTLLKASEKSSRIESIWLPSFRDLARSLMVNKSCDLHEQCFLKPCCVPVSMLFSSRLEIMLLCRMCSSIYQGIDVRLIGKKFSAFDFSPFPGLNTGATNAWHQFFGVYNLQFIVCGSLCWFNYFDTFGICVNWNYIYCFYDFVSDIK